MILPRPWQAGQVREEFLAQDAGLVARFECGPEEKTLHSRPPHFRSRIFLILLAVLCFGSISRSGTICHSPQRQPAVAFQSGPAASLGPSIASEALPAHKDAIVG